MSVPILRTRAELRARTQAWRAEGLRIAVVPTMGALHEGHLSLVRAALERAERVVVTLFVNPRQFNSAADLAAYPRTETSDAAKLAPLGAHLLYAPGVEEMYPPSFATTISVTGVSAGLCGAHRPGHFDGVATVVAKLLLQTDADLALFGEKDFQQLQVVRRLARDLDLRTTILGRPVVRETDGLALSSRNQRLSPEERALAPRLAEALRAAASFRDDRPERDAPAESARIGQPFGRTSTGRTSTLSISRTSPSQAAAKSRAGRSAASSGARSSSARSSRYSTSR